MNVYALSFYERLAYAFPECTMEGPLLEGSDSDSDFTAQELKDQIVDV